uniref:SIR2-like domain-containing protein n=1 Tax=Candidatus Kentrum sp. LPFa TaxID=2126335 RepID=A0A450W959_9GAMM|nr:MAG: SIR2-like domain-containing protein [Candidatus Kentron sp. LPFa]VFK29633.1 MAG: SIR2-like domain-containing protein [Candidatus Kentron sp. LPFa]
MEKETAAADIDSDITEVIDAAKAGRIVYFFGAGVSAGVQGLPNGTKLSEWFTEQLWKDGKLEEPPDGASHDENSRYYDDLGDVCEELQLSSQLYEQAFERHRLVEILAKQYGRVEPTPHGSPYIYDRIIQCVKRKKEAGQETQPTIFFTTNFDNLLELTLEHHGVEYDLLLHERMANPAKPPDFHYRQNSSLKTNNNFERINRLSPLNIPNKNPLVIKLHGCLQERCVESGREKIPLTVTDQDYLSPSLYKLHESLPISIRLKLLDNRHYLKYYFT